MSLYLLSFRPDFAKLMALAAREKLLPPGDDLGYALHAVLAASFAEGAPKPFRLFMPGELGGGPSGRLLAYSANPLAAIKAHAATFADPGFSASLTLDSAEEKSMPADFVPGTRLGFSIRIRPVRRTGKSKDNQTKAQERDIFVGNEEGGTGHAARANAYGAWLEQQLTGAAALEICTISALRQTRLMTRKRANGEKLTAYVIGPDAIFSGILQVGNTAAFAALLARGVGRFRSFGFGMMLLKPPI